MLLTILLAASIASIVDLGGLVLFWDYARSKRFIYLILSFAAGVLLTASFQEIIPEGLAEGASLLWVMAGFGLFFVIERGIIIHQCRDENCDVHAGSYLIAIGDTIHDFLDGVTIAISFLVSWQLGIVSTLAIVLHEIPSGFGSFAVLLAGVASRRFLWIAVVASSVAAPLGALTTYLVRDWLDPWMGPLLLAVGGGFIYIAAVDLIPETHHDTSRIRSVLHLIIFGLGILSMYLIDRII
ncbi:MAG TPA: ZIP family metal transporter, partial [Patescibacteria group bacterium]|nr:ZIP family metal transporter [Patescibacteria group bacterium]